MGEREREKEKEEVAWLFYIDVEEEQQQQQQRQPSCDRVRSMSICFLYERVRGPLDWIFLVCGVCDC